MRIAILAITRNGSLLGKKLSAAMTGADLYVSSRYAGQAGKARHIFEPEELRALLVSLWKNYDGFVLIMAAGIVVRMIAPLLESKVTDPAVVVMDDASRFAVSLLSGHIGGANELAERCAFISGACAVITTATDANALPSFDMLAKEQGWAVDDISKVKTLNALLLDNAEIAVVDPGGRVRSWFHGRGNLTFHDTFAEAIHSDAKGFLFVTNRHLPPQTHPSSLLILRPGNLVLGIGCNRGTPVEEINDFVAAHLKRIFLSIKSVCCIGTAEAKRDETGLVSYAQLLGVPLKFYESAELNSAKGPSPDSRYAAAAIGANGVAEPAALLASGHGPFLLKKVKSENVTLAVAELNNS